MCKSGEIKNTSLSDVSIIAIALKLVLVEWRQLKKEMVKLSTLLVILLFNITNCQAGFSGNYPLYSIINYIFRLIFSI